MELSHLTLEELERKLRDLDPSLSPHEALELSNAIGRRKAEQASLQPVTDPGKNVLPFAKRFMFISVIVFLVTCHFQAPAIRTLQIVGALSILYTITCIFVWTTRNFILEIVISMSLLAALDYFNFGIVQIVQCYSFFYGVHYTLVYVFKNKIERAIKKTGTKREKRQCAKSV